MTMRDQDLAQAVIDDWREADIDARLRAILVFADKLTLEPRAMLREDVDALREVGLDDRAILEMVQVTAYFNFVNRLADGLGVALELPG
jgi:uncharacterized peroxidase-related enzyme